MTEPGLRARKKEATRQAIRAAAVALYRSRGPHDVTVDQICEKAGVSGRTFFNYFDSKEAAVFSIALTADGVRTGVAARPAKESPLASLRAVFTERFEEVSNDPTFGDRALLLREYPELWGRLAHVNKVVEEAAIAAIAERTGLARDDLYVRITVEAAFAANRSAFKCWYPGSEPGLVELLHRAMDALASGLEPPA
ncbi:TetR/AcrR family transcriptional regulator [Amycolatopsis rhabdoformis]|uniref:TetR/AcrR family transcriptional regulator n=1 Tax=Amycolatopsis rhabdoformis TaxID=1448059 RepID=A0ABZ1HYC3_9PSEU|nr:TetR/AcrR family transcriptional regulator [Amycolatopsis rhabdoformis]WSE26616.1 TetR/AcrR family transcriptional regulator [Amycolatopsis rhabdoformis]